MIGKMKLTNFFVAFLHFFYLFKSLHFMNNFAFTCLNYFLLLLEQAFRRSMPKNKGRQKIKDHFAKFYEKEPDGRSPCLHHHKVLSQAK